MGLAGAFVMGTIVFFINSDHGIGIALVAALKQSTYTFLAGGTMMRITENLAANISNQYLAIATAVIVPTMIAVTLTYILHSIKGTPDKGNRVHGLVVLQTRRNRFEIIVVCP